MKVEELFERHGEAVTRYVRRRLADQADADEVVADVFVRAWRSETSRPADADRERAWLYAIARNAVIDRYRRAARSRRLLERLMSTFTGGVEPPPDLPGDGALAEALRALSDHDRELLRLVAWEQLPHAEIAQLLGCREANVALRIHRARARLRRQLDRGTPSAPQAAPPLSERPAP